MSDFIVRSVRVCDSGSTLHEKRMDLCISDGKFVQEKPQNALEINGEGLTMIPALFDMQVHCGEPGHEERDDLQSVSNSALAGGISEVLLVSAENPVTDSRQNVEFLKNRSIGLPIRFHIAGALTEQMQGQNLAGLYDMRLGGAAAFFDHVKAIEKEQVLVLAMQYASLSGGLVIVLPTVEGLRMGGIVHEGHESVKLGLKGSPSIAEEAAIERFIRLTEWNKTPLHISGISSVGSVQLIRDAKLKGVPISCSVFIHHLILTDSSLHDFDTNYKVWPPLRSEIDRQALVEGVKDGTIDVVCSDHKSLSVEDKLVEFDFAHYGIVGLESILGLLNRVLGDESLHIVNKVMNANPRRLLGIEERVIEQGSLAEFVLIDTDDLYDFDLRKLKSKQQNSPFGGMSLKGKIRGIFTSGRWFPC